MRGKRGRELTAPEESVLDDAVQHGVVKVGQWKLDGQREVGGERLQAADKLSRKGLLFQTGESPPVGVRRKAEEYVPTPRSRRRRDVSGPA